MTPTDLRAAHGDAGEGLREAAARELFDDVANDQHGQLCPIWTQRANKKHKPIWTDCNCWQLRRVRRQAALALGAPLVRAALAADTAPLREAALFMLALVDEFFGTDHEPVPVNANDAEAWEAEEAFRKHRAVIEAGS